MLEASALHELNTLSPQCELDVLSLLSAAAIGDSMGQGEMCAKAWNLCTKREAEIKTEHLRSRGKVYLQPSAQKGPPFVTARLIATAFHEATKPGTVEGARRGVNIITGVREREGTGEGGWE